MNTAINIETLVWRLSNTRKNNFLLIKTNNISDNKMNLSFERLFGKLINNQENMARIVSSQQGGRMIQKAAKGNSIINIFTNRILNEKNINYLL